MSGESLEILIGRDRTGRDYKTDLMHDRIISIQHHDNPLIIEFYKTIIRQLKKSNHYHIKINTYENNDKYIKRVIGDFIGTKENNHFKEEVELHIIDLDDKGLELFKETLEELYRQTTTTHKIIITSSAKVNEHDLLNKTVIDMNQGDNIIDTVKLYKMPLPKLTDGEIYIKRTGEVIPNRVTLYNTNHETKQPRHIKTYNIGWSFIKLG